MFKCSDGIMMNEYEAYYPKCSDSLDFTKSDHVERRKTLMDGKACVLSISGGTECSKTARNYLRSRYDKFVNILTTKPEDEGCNSLFADLNKYQCSSMSRGMEKYWKSIKMGNTVLLSNGKNMCNNLEECSSDPCNSYPTSKQMEKCEVFDALASEYKECITYERYKLGGCKENDKKCLQKKMMEHCEGVEDFDKYYEWFKLNDNKYTNYTIVGNYTRFDNVKIPTLVIPANREIGKCSPIVEELVFAFSTLISEDPRIFYQKMLEKCNKITECYGSINTEESQKLKDYYQNSCESFEFHINQMYTCLNNFYKKEYSNGKTFENDSFFSKNLTIKRDAFVKKKSYFLEFANTKCNVRGREYLNSNYDHFVDLITVKPTNDDCKSVFAETEGYQCLQFHKNATSGHGYWMYPIPDFAVYFSKECQLAEKCLKASICFPRKGAEILEQCNYAKEMGVYFYSCLEKLKTDNQDYSKYNCTQEKITKQTTGVKFLLQFKSSPNCLKTIMLAECGSNSVVKFNKHFEDVVKKNN